MGWIRSVINLLPTIVGVVQGLLPLLKELAVVVVRIIAILPFAWSVAEPMIEKVNKVYDKIYGGFETFKNWMLWIPKK